MSQFIQVSAGSHYGTRDALYEIVEQVLVLRHRGNDDNLAGNAVALDFEGLTLEQAHQKKKAYNDEPIDHVYNGCHACQFSIAVQEVEPPGWYTYQEPPEAEAIRKVLSQFNQQRESEEAI